MKIWEPKPPGIPLGHTGPVTGLLYLYLLQGLKVPHFNPK